VNKTIMIVVLALGAAGCKQGRGERCEVDADCADGLTCPSSEPKVCGGESGATSIDAAPPIPPGPAAQ
jgi:hypothetical protein